MSEVHRYKAIKLKTAAGNIITYSPHGPEFVPAEAYDQLRAELSALKAGQGEAAGWITEDYLTDKSATTYSKEMADRWLAKGWPVRPIYLAPSYDPDTVPVRRELLNRAVELIEYDTHYPFCEPQTPKDAVKRSVTSELRALLEQSEGVKP